MGKRTRNVSEDYESIAKRIRKLEQELMHTRRRDKTSRPSRRSSRSSSDTSRSTSRSSSSSSSRSSTPPGGRAGFGATVAAGTLPMPPVTLCIEDVPPIPSTSAAPATAPLPSTSAALATELPSASAVSHLGTAAPTISADVDLSLTSTDPTPALDNELLLILGDDPSQAKSYGDYIQADLAIRLEYMARMGLSREIRKELTDKYLPPANCTLIEAPTLNPEVVAAVPEAVYKRDKGIELRQNQRTSAISCVAQALTVLMSSEPKNTALIQILMDATKLMCDSQNADSAIRRNFILNTLKKDLKDQLQATKIDKLLFSEGLAETLKAAKAISKTGADMKPAPTKQAPIKNKPQQKHLNWRAPPQNYRPKGNPRTKELTYKDRPANSSKQSSRPAHNRNRNRR